MATTTKLFAAAAIPMVILFSNLQTVTSEPAILASPAVNAPNMSSFFPSQSPPQWPTSSAVAPDSEASAPIPTSGEFVGKSSSGSVKSDGGILMLLGLLFLIVMRLFSTL
ncbi:hypothetical protein PTKIN_Ptkin07bG0003700 [Pterospermum kingtungense]